VPAKEFNVYIIWLWFVCGPIEVRGIRILKFQYDLVNLKMLSWSWILVTRALDISLWWKVTIYIIKK
jgi:hypothetical protein